MLTPTINQRPRGADRARHLGDGEAPPSAGGDGRVGPRRCAAASRCGDRRAREPRPRKPEPREGLRDSDKQRCIQEEYEDVENDKVYSVADRPRDRAGRPLEIPPRMSRAASAPRSAASPDGRACDRNSWSSVNGSSSWAGARFGAAETCGRPPTASSGPRSRARALGRARPRGPRPRRPPLRSRRPTSVAEPRRSTLGGAPGVAASRGAGALTLR